MVDKIEKFNATGEMEGVSGSSKGPKVYSSMKQEVMDMCESKYDAEVRKYCIDQPTEVSNFNHPQIREKNCILPTYRTWMICKSE